MTLRRIAAVVALWFAATLLGCGASSPSGPPEVPSPDAAVGPDAGVDPGAAGGCGDGVCASPESCSSCPGDCGACGDGCESGIDFATQIQPILDTSCVGCHGGDGGLRLGSLAALLVGGASGPAVVPCDCENSLLIRKLGASPPFGAQMPRGRTPLPPAQIALICQWINQGAEAVYDPATCGSAPAPGACGGCGDGACDASESCDSCPADCGECPPPDGEDDVTPPEFDGADDTDERGDDECVVSWDPASDDVTPRNEIVYEVFVTERDGAFDLDRPTATTAPGATSHVLRLRQGRRFDVLVRAVDQAGNRDDNDRTRDCDFR